MTLEITSAETRKRLSEWIGVPWSIYPGRYPGWVPPLRVMVKEMVDPKHDPFWKNAERTLFTARRDGKAIGRIAAIHNRRHNEIHHDRVGFFGFFECIDEQEVADALFQKAMGWLQERGLDRIRGPVNPSMNHETGLLTHGFDQHPTLLTPWNPPYYETLIRRSGFEVEREMYGYRFDVDGGFRAPERLDRMVERRSLSSGIVFRNMDHGRVKEEIDLILPLYNEAWKHNWGFVPFTSEEFFFTAKSLNPLLMKHFGFIAEKDGQAVGFCLMAADLNRILKKIPSGRLGPIALLRLLLGVPRLRHGRIMLLGLHPDHRQGILFPMFLREMMRRSETENLGSAEASWVLAENAPMRAPLESLGLEPYRHWRVFEKAIP